MADASAVWASGARGDTTTATANLPGMTIDDGASVITVVLSEAFMAHFFADPVKGDEVELTQLTLGGLILNLGESITINLTTVNGYMFGDQTSLTFNGITGTGGDVVLSDRITLTYVPEPTTATLGILGLAGLLLRRRRKA